LSRRCLEPPVDHATDSEARVRAVCSIAFAGTDVPYMNWVASELAVKLGVALCTLVPFRYLTRRR